MMNTKASIGDDITTVCKDENCTIYQLNNKTGEGIMTCYQVFPGIHLMYNDFHMQNCYTDIQHNKEVFSINHCREGRIQWDLKNGTYLYLKAGDIKIDKEHHHKGLFFYTKLIY